MKVCDADKCMFVCMFVVSAAVHGILYNMSIITRKHVSHSAPRYIRPPTPSLIIDMFPSLPVFYDVAREDISSYFRSTNQRDPYPPREKLR